jgi:hypothetical protein
VYRCRIAGSGVFICCWSLTLEEDVPGTMGQTWWMVSFHFGNFEHHFQICVWDYIFNSWVLWWCSIQSWNYQPLSQSPNPTNEQGQICFVVVELMSSKWLPAVIAKLVGPPAWYLSWCNKLVNPAKLNKHAYLKGGHLVFFWYGFPNVSASVSYRNTNEALIQGYLIVVN